MRAVCADSDLRAGEAHGLHTQRLYRHCKQSHAHLLARGKQHVHLTGARSLVDLLRQIHEHIGLVSHGTHDHHHLIASFVPSDGLRGGSQNFLSIGHTRATKLLNDKGHRQLCSCVWMRRSRRSLSSTSSMIAMTTMTTMTTIT